MIFLLGLQLSKGSDNRW